jgi:hypothetical protein
MFWLEVFLGSVGSANSLLSSLSVTSRAYPGGFASPSTLRAWRRDDHRRLRLPYCVTPSLITNIRGAGILTGYPSPTSFDLGLGPASPWADNPSPGNLRLTAEEILTPLYATYTGMLTSLTSTSPHGPASQVTGTLPYHLNGIPTV